MKRFLMSLFLALLLCGIAAADTLHLKDGREITGKIVDDNGYRIKIVSDQGTRVFYTHEIARIVRQEKQTQNDGANLAGNMAEGGISSEERALIVRFLEANGARDGLAAIFQGVVANSPPESREEIRRALDMEDFMDVLLPLYAKYYTENEIKELIAFYKSPIGQKHIGLASSIMEETMKAAAAYFQDRIKGVAPISP